ncbi:integrase catalytic domain-containing protein [Trichonephila clavipes]|nr:integrase catalytic domain-containing protein [Trichonephila clavipes]
MPTHCQARLQWCLFRSGWNHADGGHIVFSGKFHFQMCPENHPRCVWRRLVQRADPAFTTARHTSLQTEVMVWVPFLLTDGPLWESFRGTFTAQRKSYNELSDNYPLAKQRFQNLCRRFGHDSELYQQYREIIRDYTEQGIIEEVKTEITDNKLKRPVYYLPHQAIRKDGRLTSKTRIVFDAGSHQNNELSLNDCLWPGINLNPNLLDILTNFRLNAIAFCSDIKQAFLQICLADEHKDAVRFLWSDDEPCVHKRPKLQVYRFNRVNFGVSSSPFLLEATIRSSSNFTKSKNIMEAAGMDLRKWITNDANLMEQWKKENFNVHPVHETVSLGANGTKVLGLSWNTNEDYLTTDTKSLLEFVSLDKNTKRFILQAVGKIFDPLGLISPFTVRMKCLLQDLWKEEIQWDDPLPTHIEKEWKKWCEELTHLRNLKIPRLVLDSTLLEDDVELHSFCDASKKAYGAAIYLRTKSRNGISVKLVTSKGRVAPLNCVTLPRLELLGALVAARLASKVKKIVNLKRSCLQYHWTDSKIVLFWIKGNKTRWKQFVANRVNEITSLTDPHSWYHCAGKENPADFRSRGLSADCLVSNSRWWTGAEFLSDSEFPKYFQQVVPELDYLTEHEKETVVQERKKLPEADRSEEIVLLNNDSSSILDELLELSNNYFKVINILSYIFRFNYNCRNKSKKVGPLTVAEFKESEIKLIKHAQRSLFDKKEIPSCISNLFPFVDGEGIVRVGGRLENASVSYLHKHPAILPKGSKLSKLYFNSLHTRLFLVGPQGLLNAVRQKFWPLSGRSIACKTVHQCVTCFKSRPILSSQIMGNLPSERVNISSPFTIAGLDLYGPFLVKYKNQRKRTQSIVHFIGKNTAAGKRSFELSSFEREGIFTSHCSATRGLLVTDLVIFNHGQVTRTTPELTPPSPITPHQRKEVWALDRFKVHRSPTRWIFSGNRLELMTRQPCESVTLTTRLLWPATSPNKNTFLIL